MFTRKGENLEVEVPLTIPEALRGAEVKVPTLNGTKTLRVRRARARHRPAAARRGPAETRRGRAAKGDIHYRFVIDVPEHLSEEQQEAVEELSQTIDGDPRAGLFATAPILGPPSPAREPRHAAGGEQWPRRRRPPPAAAGGVRIPTVTRVEVETDRGVFMISVAAELANMHPQTLRMYEARGLIEPQRSPRARACTPRRTSSASAASRR